MNQGGNGLGDYDVVVVGGGPAGLTAGLYAGRARLKTCLLERAFPGGQAALTHWVENYPGFPEGLSGAELAERMAAQARRLGVEFVTGEATRLLAMDGGWQVVAGGERVGGRTVIIAGGAGPKHLGCPGEDRLRGRGVSYCATCDGAFFRDRVVHVVGGGDSAAVEALFLTRFARQVILVHRRGELRATPVVQEELLANPRVSVRWNAEVAAIEGADRVEGVTLRYTDGRSELEASDGVFVYVGTAPNTDWLGETVPRDGEGYLQTDERLRLPAPGLFAAGDVRRKGLRQIVTAVADGATAAVEAVEYLARPGYAWRASE
jgi:thioredoxin reductase (NADPH)